MVVGRGWESPNGTKVTSLWALAPLSNVLCQGAAKEKKTLSRGSGLVGVGEKERGQTET